ncbi:MAG: DUF1016 N-terminal domain-containing protein [Bacteroidales bacterium]|nr:DUF1016 N-terminal domain-containing protein [Bacteroidales bacterium]
MEHITSGNIIISQDYQQWRKEIVSLIEQSKLQAVLNVNKEMLALYWKIGNDILKKQEQLGWGAQVINQLSKDLTKIFPDDRGYSERNLRNMKRFAEEYPDFPFVQVPFSILSQNNFWQVALAESGTSTIWQVPLAKIEKDGEVFVNVPLTQITWYHHISLISKIETLEERAFYINVSSTKLTA